MRSSTALLLLISCFFAKFARSQSNELIVQGQTGSLYLQHTVVAKENWYSVGRMYNINPKELAPFNHSALTQPLMIGQLLQVPLTATNFTQNGDKAPGETLVPVLHITQDKEWLYRISVNHNKVPVASLEKWNKITPEQVHAGMHLIVGYLKVKTNQSALARMPAPSVAVTTAPTQNTAPTPTTATTQTKVPTQTTTPAETATPAQPTASPSQSPATASVPPANASTSPTTVTDSPVSKPAAAIRPTPSTVTPPATTTTKASTAAANPATTPAAKMPTATSPATTPAASTPPAPHFNGGTFRPEFTDGGHSATGPAGVFKSTSGWQDGKYYALMNNATVGAIVKITDPTSGRSVYAKILGQLPDMKESAGLTIRISNAAAAELGEGEGRFNAQINF